MIEQSTLAITYRLEWEYTLLAIDFATYKGKKLQQNIYFIVVIMFHLFFLLGLGGVESLLDKNYSTLDWWNGVRIFNLKKYYVINKNINTMYIISRSRADLHITMLTNTFIFHIFYQKTVDHPKVIPFFALAQMMQHFELLL